MKRGVQTDVDEAAVLIKKLAQALESGHRFFNKRTGEELKTTLGVVDVMLLSQDGVRVELPGGDDGAK